MSARKLDPTTKVLNKFQRKLRAAETRPGTVGTLECTQQFRIPTASNVLTEAKKQGHQAFNQAKRQAKQERRINSKLKATWRKYNWLWKHADDIDPMELNDHARDLGNTIYDLPALWTGYRTKDAIKKGEKVKEHFYPRQWSGYAILEYIFASKGISPTRMRRFFDVFRQVHYTTSEENQKLRDLQDSQVFADWRQPYKERCSPLVQEEDRGEILEIDYAWEDKGKI